MRGASPSRCRGADPLLGADGDTCGNNMHKMVERDLSGVARLKFKTVVLILHLAPSAQPNCGKRVVSSDTRKGKIEQLD